MHIPPYLKKGDTVGIVAPAKAIEKGYVEYAINFWENEGFKVKLGSHCLGRSNYFSGTDAQRASDFQTMLDDDEVKAIICARGGYGCVRLIDRINWAGLVNQPKWIIGFSDVTVFHQYANKLEVASMHGTMPLNYKENTPRSLESMMEQLKGQPYNYEWNAKTVKTGSTTGKVIGGNLAVLAGLIGTRFSSSFDGKILFLEEIGEPLYAIDRMFYQLSASGILERLSGLILGSFSGIKDTEHPYGETLESIIMEHLKFTNIPVAFEFPIGHQNDNCALIVGGTYQLDVNQNGTCTLKL